MITWRERVSNFEEKLGRKPTLDELLDLNRNHTITFEEVEAQRQSFIRGMTTRCEHGELDFEQCPKCRGEINGFFEQRALSKKEKPFID